ncbi:MAG: formyltransferase [Betaproteobacteria bacterium]|nr:formyltransferase [Betaproteobacteria bacterium]
MSCAASAVVFANHDVGVRCLLVLLAGGIDVRLVVAHDEEPEEGAAFASVVETAISRGIEVALPDDVDDKAFVQRVATLAPDFIFSFYYRQMLSTRVLNLAKLGALNMHGSLLPRYRGRAPVNWAVIRGETRTGATLHHMTEKPDAGDIVDQEAVPILPDDTAFDVFRKITVSAEVALWRSLPALVDGTARSRPQCAAAATYFGRRRPEDGRIDWSASANAIHDLVRGVAPPYPGAFTIIRGRTLRILRTAREPKRLRRFSSATLYVDGGGCYVDCGGGGVLRILEAELDGVPVSAEAIDCALGIVGALSLEGR